MGVPPESPPKGPVPDVVVVDEAAADDRLGFFDADVRVMRVVGEVTNVDIGFWLFLVNAAIELELRKAAWLIEFRLKIEACDDAESSESVRLAEDGLEVEVADRVELLFAIEGELCTALGAWDGEGRFVIVCEVGKYEDGLVNLDDVASGLGRIGVEGWERGF